MDPSEKHGGGAKAERGTLAAAMVARVPERNRERQSLRERGRRGIGRRERKESQGKEHGAEGVGVELCSGGCSCGWLETG